MRYLIAVIVALLAACLYSSYRSEKEWKRYAAEHKCRETGFVTGDAGVGIGTGANGTPTTVVVTTPDKHIYTCDGGYQIIR